MQGRQEYRQDDYDSENRGNNKYIDNNIKNSKIFKCFKSGNLHSTNQCLAYGKEK